MEISSDSSKVLGVVANVRNFKDEENAVSTIKKHFEPLDYVVTNAGLGVFLSIDELEIEVWNDWY